MPHLIADSGSTKTNWCLIREEGTLVQFHTEGLNPFFVGGEEILMRIEAAFPRDANPADVDELDFYGAGCMGIKREAMSNALQRVFTGATVRTHLDLLGAARGLLGERAGFAAILGTGTNTCLYDGKVITHHIDSLGFILGDEGSGRAIGGRLLGDYIRGYMPDGVRQMFCDTYKLSPGEIMDRVYGEPHASRFCASFTRFFSPENLKHDYLHGIISNAFHDLFENLVRHYPSYRDFSFNCAGSVAHAFRDILKEVAQQFGMATGVIAASPMPGLIQFHTGRVNTTVL